MMIKCQKCGFENQMGSIFCRECGEKLDMDAIDPNKLQKDVNKEKRIKATKKKIKGLISGACAVLVVGAFIGIVFYNGGLRVYEEPDVQEASASQKFTAAVNGTASGKVKYSYPEVNQMLKTRVVEPLSKIESFAKVTAMEVAYDAEKNQSVAYLWISIKDKVPVLYTIHGIFTYNVPDPDNPSIGPTEPILVNVKRLDIGRLPVFAGTASFLNGFKSLVDNDAMQGFFDRAKSVEFSADGMTVEFSGKSAAPSASYTPAATTSNKPSSATATAALKGGSAAASEKAEAARQKAEEEKAKQEQLAEERKRKAEEYKQQQKEKEEERKRKAEEEKERRKQEAEERKRKQEEENERRRQEREDRRNNNYNNNNYGNSRNSRSSRSSRSSRNNRY